MFSAVDTHCPGRPNWTPFHLDSPYTKQDDVSGWGVAKEAGSSGSLDTAVTSAVVSTCLGRPAARPSQPVAVVDVAVVVFVCLYFQPYGAIGNL